MAFEGRSVRTRAIAVGALLTWFACSASAAGLDGVYTDAKTINAVLESIPMRDPAMGYKSLAQRLPNLSLRVERIDVGAFTAEEVRMSGGSLRKGDVDYRFTTSEPSAVVKALCPVSTRFTMLKRGRQWIPQDRAANFLMNGNSHCVAPPVVGN